MRATRVFLAFAQLIFCYLVSVARTQPANRNSGILTGDIADGIEGAPIPSAFVLVHGGGGRPDAVVKLDRTARFSVSLAPGNYDIFVAAEGFAPTCRRVSVVAGRTTRYAPRLKANEETLEQSSTE